MLSKLFPGNDRPAEVVCECPAPQSAPAEIADIPDLDAPHHSSDPSGLSSVTGNLSISKTPAGDDAIPDIDDIPDMDDEDLDAGTTGVVEEEDAAQVKPSGTTGGKIEVGQTNPGNLVNVRTYDCLITYDKCVLSTGPLSGR